MELATIARPYARAVFELAPDAPTRKVWSAALAAIAEAVAAPGIAPLLETPAIGRDQLAQIIGDAFLGRPHDAEQLPPEDQLRGLLRLLAENRRLTVLPVIAAEFEALRARAEARIDVQIVTAEADVPQAQRTALETALGKRFEQQVTVDWQSDPDLISGALIRSGDFVIDGSVRGELQRLSRQLAH